eukprot:1052906-Prorocentrum_minimum.AAC.2
MTEVSSVWVWSSTHSQLSSSRLSRATSSKSPVRVRSRTTTASSCPRPVATPRVSRPANRARPDWPE